MPSKDSVVKTARVNAEDWKAIQALMDREGITFSGVVHKLVNSDTLSDEFDIMCRLCGGTPQEVMDDICEKLNSGELLIESGKITIGEGCTPIDLTRFIEACSEKGVEPQKMIDKATQMVWRS